MAEMNGLQPFDADENLVGLVPAGDLEFLALRCAAAHEDRVVFRCIEQRAKAVHR